MARYCSYFHCGFVCVIRTISVCTVRRDCFCLPVTFFRFSTVTQRVYRQNWSIISAPKKAWFSDLTWSTSLTSYMGGEIEPAQALIFGSRNIWKKCSTGWKVLKNTGDPILSNTVLVLIWILSEIFIFERNLLGDETWGWYSPGPRAVIHAKGRVKCKAN